MFYERQPYKKVSKKILKITFKKLATIHASKFNLLYNEIGFCNSFLVTKRNINYYE